MRQRTTVLAAVLSILMIAVLALLLFSTERSSTHAVTIEFEICSNPTIEFDGAMWETKTVAPKAWRDAGVVAGNFVITADVGVFSGPEGRSITLDKRIGKFSEMTCFIAN